MEAQVSRASRTRKGLKSNHFQVSRDRVRRGTLALGARAGTSVEAMLLAATDEFDEDEDEEAELLQSLKDGVAFGAEDPDTEAGVLLYARVVAAYESESAEKPCSLAVGDVVAVVDEKATGWCALSPCAIQ